MNLKLEVLELLRNAEYHDGTATVLTQDLEACERAMRYEADVELGRIVPNDEETSPEGMAS